MFSGSEEERAAYRRLWGIDPPGEVQSTPPAVGAPVRVRLPLNEHQLQEEWQFARDRVELLLHKTGFDVQSVIHHPYLEPLETLILKAWDILGTPQVFAACLHLIEQMHEDPSAAALGYEELKVGLGLGGDYWLQIDVAALQVQYQQTNPIWQTVKRSETGTTKDSHADGTDPASGQTH